MAIARDATSFGYQAAGTANLTFSHTVGGGSNTILLVFVADWGGDHVTGVTAVKGGSPTAMTQIIKAAGDTTKNGENYIYGILAPDAGAHNIVISRSSSSGNVYGISQSYSGVRQYSMPDASLDDGRSTSATYNVGMTTIADNCWLFLCAENGNVAIPSGPKVLDNGGNLTVIKNDINTTDGVAAFDNQGAGPKTPAGAFAASVTTTSPNGGCTWSGLSVSIAPVYVAPISLSETQASTDNVASLLRKRFIALSETVSASDAFVYLADRWHALAKNVGAWTSQSKSS